MSMHDWLPDPHHLSDVIAGALGGAVRWAALKLPFRDGLLALLIGSICALYMAPIGDALLGTVLSRLISDPQQSLRLGGFFIGIAGIASFGFVIEALRIWRGQRSIP